MADQLVVFDRTRFIRGSKSFAPGTVISASEAELAPFTRRFRPATVDEIKAAGLGASVPAVPVAPAVDEVEPVALDPFDHDGDGKPGGSLPKRKRRKDAE